MALSITLPTAGGTLAPYALRGTVLAKPEAGLKFNRIAYSAAHVVADPLAAVDPWLQAAVDWPAVYAPSVCYAYRVAPGADAGQGW